MLIVIGLIDYVTGYEIGISFFYLIPVSFAAWFGGRPQGIIVSFLSVLIITIADFMAGKVYPHLFIELWNLLMHFGFFTFFVVVISLEKPILMSERDW